MCDLFNYSCCVKYKMSEINNDKYIIEKQDNVNNIITIKSQSEYESDSDSSSDSILYKNEKDYEKLMSLNEIQRELILYNRSQKKLRNSQIKDAYVLI